MIVLLCGFLHAEKKFAVGSGSKCVPVCYYDEEPNWWVSKIIKKHKSTVLSVDWHPNAPYIATGSSDLKCRIFSCFVKDVDSKDFGKQRPFGGEGKPTFGEVVLEFPSNGWVHSVRWSPSGNTLAYCCESYQCHSSFFSPLHNHHRWWCCAEIICLFFFFFSSFFIPQRMMQVLRL
jgi:WD40 repeat protein